MAGCFLDVGCVVLGVWVCFVQVIFTIQAKHPKHPIPETLYTHFPFPLVQILSLDGSSHQFREQVGRTGKSRDIEGGKSGGVFVVISRCAIVAEGEERNHGYARLAEFVRFFEHFGAVTSFKQITDKYQNGVLWNADQRLRIYQGFMNIRSTAQLCSKQQFDRVVQMFAKVYHCRIEYHNIRLYRPHGSECGAQYAGKYNRAGHGSALIGEQDDVAQRLAFATESDERLRNDRLVFRLVVL